MNNIRHKAYAELDSWLKMSQDQILDKFQSINKSFGDGKGQKRFVYVPGTRKDRVCLVAHADTVIDPQLPIETIEHNGIILSANRKREIKYKPNSNVEVTKFGWGIGADDRAGCAMLWQLRELGHSILISSGEESGCVASKWLIEQDYWREELNYNHNFLIEFDRREKNDAVFYDVGTNKFVEFIKQNTGYQPASGYGTDIKYLCKDVCGVNFSVGYYSEHLAEEKIVIDYWLNTLLMAKQLLSMPDLPRFDLDKKDIYEYKYKHTNNYHYHHNNGYQSQDSDDYYYRSGFHNNELEGAIATKQKSYEGQVVYCENCENRMSVDDWYDKEFNCSKCGQEI
jgi:hypothetical protein